jgi:hypothetical protein
MGSADHGDEGKWAVPFHPFHLGEEVIHAHTGLHADIWDDPPPSRYLHQETIPTLAFQAPPREPIPPGPRPPGRALAL